ncbi:hypothetical protein HAX54_009758 [Datura stramonium]|uniref:Uncharacterized protein n=1 Tax=Datura stramonium TaxID=4076 RepID=A0ABS8RX35_DATST|nr:hypothetical protein [Datura stramonium]
MSAMGIWSSGMISLVREVLSSILGMPLHFAKLFIYSKLIESPNAPSSLTDSTIEHVQIWLTRYGKLPHCLQLNTFISIAMSLRKHYFNIEGAPRHRETSSLPETIKMVPSSPRNASFIFLGPKFWSTSPDRYC